jgi:hypothetical protein
MINPRRGCPDVTRATRVSRIGVCERNVDLQGGPVHAALGALIIAGGRACSTSTRLTHSVITNQTSPHLPRPWGSDGLSPLGACISSLDKTALTVTDTEGVTGSNPVAPTTVVAGQRAVSSRWTALLTYRGRAAAAIYSRRPGWALRSLTTRDQHQLNDHGGWSPPPDPAHGGASQPATCPGRTCGATCGHLLLLVLPSQRPAPWRWTSSLGGPGSERDAAAGAHAKRRPRSALDTRASHTLPTHDQPFPARPDSGSDDHAARGPSRHVESGVPNVGCPPHRRMPGSSAVRTARTQRPRTPDACPSGHPGSYGRVDIGRPPDHWTDVRTADRATSGVAGVRTSSTVTATASWAAQTPLGLPRLRRSATHEGSAVRAPAAAALTAAATGHRSA